MLAALGQAYSYPAICLLLKCKMSKGNNVQRSALECSDAVPPRAGVHPRPADDPERGQEFRRICQGCTEGIQGAGCLKALHAPNGRESSFVSAPALAQGSRQVGVLGLTLLQGPSRVAGMYKNYGVCVMA